jgi:hypothetical protein
MNSKGLWKKRRGLIVVPLRHIPGLTEENHQIFKKDSRYPSRDSNWAPPECKRAASELYQPARFDVSTESA